jgi:hypothetical protein
MPRHYENGRPEISSRDLLEPGLTREEIERRSHDKMICSLYNKFCYDCPQYLCQIRRL